MNTQPPSAAISTVDISKRYGKRDALRGVSLSVERGTTCGLIGLNGAGKSTLIRTLVGLLPPDSGSVTVAGENPWESDRARVRMVEQIGYVPDRPIAYGWMRVCRALEFAAAAWSRAGDPGQAGAWDPALAARLLKQYGLDPQQKCGKLSKGQGAKLSLLLALAHRPAVLILDEPTDGLDPVSRDEFLEQVLASTLNGDGRSDAQTVLISSHALGDLQRLTDVVGILHEGKLVVHAPTAGLVATTKRLRIVLESTGDAPAFQLPTDVVCQHRRGREWTLTLRSGSDEAAAKLRASANVAAVTVEDLSLDDVFKDVVRGLSPAPEVASC